MEKTLAQIAHEAHADLLVSTKMAGSREEGLSMLPVGGMLSRETAIIEAACREAIDQFATALTARIQADRSYVPNGYLWQHFLSLIDAERQRRP